MLTGTAIGLVAFAGFWWLVLSIFANLGGWAALAKNFPAQSTMAGPIYRLQAGRFGWVDYNGCLNIQVGAEGVRIWPLFPFRPGHAPMMLPWSVLRVVEVTDRWYGRHVTVEVGSPLIAKVRLPLKIFKDAGMNFDSTPR